MVKCPGVIGWKANARPPGWKVWENSPLLPEGAWALLELTDALVVDSSRRDIKFGDNTCQVLGIEELSALKAFGNLKSRLLQYTRDVSTLLKT